MIILGIDPGSRVTGFGLIQSEGKSMRYMDSGTLHFTETDDFLAKPALIYKSCLELVQKYSPDEIALEALIGAKNVSSLAKLAQARGAMLAAFGQSHTGRIFEYFPKVIKSCVSGYGGHDKESVNQSLRLFLGKLDIRAHDESDALAVAIGHAMHGAYLKKFDKLSATPHNRTL